MDGRHRRPLRRGLPEISVRSLLNHGGVFTQTRPAKHLMPLQWRRLRPRHYIALSPTQTFEAAKCEPEGVTPFWVLVVRHWPGDDRQPGSIYDISGLGHFATLRDCKQKVEEVISRTDPDSRR